MSERVLDRVFLWVYYFGFNPAKEEKKMMTWNFMKNEEKEWFIFLGFLAIQKGNPFIGKKSILNLEKHFSGIEPKSPAL